MSVNIISTQNSFNIQNNDESSVLNNNYLQPQVVINERSQQRLLFNVLPEKDINESLFIKEYRIWDKTIEAIFDRNYKTEMISSPSHLTLLSALINLQKMVYIYMHHYLNIKYDPKGQETLKVWPTELNISLPKLLTDDTDITHRLNVKTIRKLCNNKYYLDAKTTVRKSIIINGSTLIIKL